MMDSILEEYGVFDEAKRIKGKEYTNYYKSNYNAFTGVSTYDKQTTATTHLGIDPVDSALQRDISSIDIEKQKAIAESSNILENYIDLIKGNFDKLFDSRYEGNDESGKNTTFIEGRMKEDIDILKSCGWSRSQIFSHINSSYYSIESMCREMGASLDQVYQNAELKEKVTKSLKSAMNLRLNYVNKIIKLLSDMVKTNYKQLGLSEKECELYLSRLSKKDNDSTTAASELYDIIRKNSGDYEINGGTGYDFRKLGFGCIFSTNEPMKLIGRIVDGEANEKNSMLRLLQSAMRYDAVVLAHGGSGEGTKGDEEFEKKNKEFTDRVHELMEKYKKNAGADRYKNICGIIDKEVEDQKKYVEKYKNMLELSSILMKLEDSGWVKKWIDARVINVNRYQSTPIEEIDVQEEVKTLEENAIRVSKDIYDDMYDNYSRVFHIKEIRDYVENIICFKILSYADDKFSKIIKYRLPNTWTCQPTKTLNGGPFTEVNDVVRQLIKEGFKKIKIQDCNPGHHRLADDIMKTKGVLINHSDFSNWVESGDLYSNDPSLQYLIEAENDLKSFASECDIDYNDDAYIEECMKWYIDNQEIIQEGVWDSIKEFGKKVIAAIVGFFKKIIGYVKLAISKIKGLLFGTKEKPKNTKSKTPEIKVKLINLDSKKIDEFTAQCRDDLNDIWEKTTATISKEIKRQSELQSKLSKELERDLAKINPSFTNESYNKVGDTMINRFPWLFGTVDEATLPGVEQTDDDDDEITLGDAGEDTTDTSDTETTTDDEPETTEFDVDDATDDTGDDTTTDDVGEEDTGEDAGGDEEYDLPDAEDAGGEEGTGDDGGLGDDAGGGTTDDLIGGNGSGGDTVSDDVQIPNLRDVQQKLFDQLTEEQQKIKIENLKSNYSELYTRCANILKILTDSNPGDENTARVFDYVQKTMTDLQTHVYYYITNTFDTKTYIENDTQFKQFLVILNTIKNILDEINVEKKE